MTKTIAPVINREQWLTRAVPKLVEIINETGILDISEANSVTKISVSVGWPGGKSVNKVIGQCWPTGMGSGVAHLFVSPRLTDPVAVLDVLLHELIHAADDCKSGHKGAFTRCARACGLEGKPTATFAGTELKERLVAIAATLGDYPHVGIKPGQKIGKVQTTRMIKVECPACGYLVRTTSKWLEVAIPQCADPDCSNYQDYMEVS